MTTELIRIKEQFEELQKGYREYLPKVDPALIDDLLLRQKENPHITPMYMVEVFTKPGLNTQEVREYIISKTGMSPAIYDNGTHYVTNQRLTLEMLKEISDSEEVIEVTGDYTGGLGSYGASHERTSHEDRFESERELPSPLSERVSNSVATKRGGEKEIADYRYNKKKSNYRVAIYTAAGIIGAIALTGFIISGGLLPNANIVSNSASYPLPTGTEPGVLHGYVAGPAGLPAIGATVLAVQQGTDFTASAFVSVDGQYNLNLPPGNYIVVAAYPDGTNKVSGELEVVRGTAHELDFNY
jgi:hypothetical protein